MKLEIKAGKLEITPKIQKLVDEKIGSGIGKYLKNFKEDLKVVTVRIDGHSRWGYEVSASMWLPHKKHIYAEDVNKDLTVALTAIKKEMSRQITEHKNSLKRKKRLDSYA